MSSRYVVVHGHFYQPPREDPVTGEMPVECEAAPYHDFNEKILAECYKPNADLGNFGSMSFNIGPTLASWMRARHPDVLATIAESDQAAITQSGHGAAIAQSYHHTILPLATERDRRTEIRWGVRSFELLFGRKPLGIWLPETAVDTPTLEACADEGLRFTILAPTQIDTADEPHGSYRVDLPSGRAFDVVVYDGGLGGTVSFDPVGTMYADAFARDRIKPIFAKVDGNDPMVAVATDGEVYGHHHKFKDLFLHELLTTKLPQHGLSPVTAERYVSLHPARRSVGLREQSSWGCAHRLARWSSGCNCTEGDASWKPLLREAFDSLAIAVDAVYEQYAEQHLTGPWAARDAYVDVVDGARSFDDWYAEWHPGGNASRDLAHLLLEAQHHRLAMYASCAFYWEDVARLEPGYGIRRGLAAANLLDDTYGTRLARAFYADLAEVYGWRSPRSAAELHAAG